MREMGDFLSSLPMIDQDGNSEGRGSYGQGCGTVIGKRLRRFHGAVRVQEYCFVIVELSARDSAAVRMVETCHAYE